ncbi:hypothetical protein AZI86_01600 [Bdellovibrio bacteriovorus]|uniref:Methyl-accepting transducer domain-containing protein n=1 Tax=Bdellovibrio bacteriovorus TaxID=959 RepID=A0A150WN44_BDEBC|nr:methyl-accepting chemotaxis protein [Bdellovibrio bacteriovorus]KYG65796.1 hypothetical protein AZI86_01600 [Bdellovibrio bacteriovorus]
MKQLNLKIKLVGLCLGLIAVTGVVSAVAIKSNRGVGDEYEFLISKTFPKATHINKIYETFLSIRMNVRNLGLPGISEKDAKISEKAVWDGLAEVKNIRKKYEALGFSEGQKELYEVQLATWKEFEGIGGKVMSLYEEGTPEAKAKMIEIFFSSCPETAGRFAAATKALLAFHEKEVDEKNAAAQSISHFGLEIILTVGAVGSLLGILVGLFFSTSLSKSLNRVIQSISTAAGDTQSGANMLSLSSQQLSSTSTQAAASLEETVASLEELTSMVKLNTNSAKEAKALSQKSCETAEQGEVSITNLISSMSELAAGSKKIEEIINVIDDIAFQTNLLALNAAVEAARAGEQGKGFSVVAEAVRTLAMRSSVAAKDISGLIKDNVEKLHKGANIATGSGDALREILSSVKKVAALNTDIADGSDEQFRGLEQISKAMNLLDQASQGNASSSHEVAESSKKMEGQGEVLTGLVQDLRGIVEGRAA